MKKKTFTIQIPEPCSEKFSEMTPIRGGRFCEQCEKKIINFSNRTDAEIARIYEQKKGNVCGVFRPDQLNRPLEVYEKPSIWQRWKTIAATLTGLSMGLFSNAQTTTCTIPKIEQTDVRWEGFDKEVSSQTEKNRMTTVREHLQEGTVYLGVSIPVNYYSPYEGLQADFYEKEQKEPLTKAYPNPFNYEFQVDLDLKRGGYFLFNLYDQNGKLVNAETHALGRGKQQVEINLQNKKLMDGMYILQILDGKEREWIHKLIRVGERFVP